MAEGMACAVRKFGLAPIYNEYRRAILHFRLSKVTYT